MWFKKQKTGVGSRRAAGKVLLEKYFCCWLAVFFLWNAEDFDSQGNIHQKSCLLRFGTEVSSVQFPLFIRILFSIFCLPSVQQFRVLTTLGKEPFENIVGKGENAGIQHFLLFSKCFLSYRRHITTFEQELNCGLQTLWIWKFLKFCHVAKGLIIILLNKLLKITQINFIDCVNCIW